jgi:hypothetical protein
MRFSSPVFVFTGEGSQALGGSAEAAVTWVSLGNPIVVVPSYGRGTAQLTFSSEPSQSQCSCFHPDAGFHCAHPRMAVSQLGL